MEINIETFLGLSSLSWSAVSSMATVLAVIIALFLPFYVDKKKKTNLIKLIEEEINANAKLLKDADIMKDGNFDGTSINRLTLMCALLIHIDYSVWSNNNQTIAEISAKTFLKYSDIMKMLGVIKKYAIDYQKTKGMVPTSVFIDVTVKKCIKAIADRKIT